MATKKGNENKGMRVNREGLTFAEWCAAARSDGNCTSSLVSFTSESQKVAATESQKARAALPGWKVGPVTMWQYNTEALPGFVQQAPSKPASLALFHGDGSMTVVRSKSLRRGGK